MGRSIGAPAKSVPAGKVKQEESGAVISVEWAAGRMIHRVSELGLRADYPIAYQIGAGIVGHSYVARVGEYLLESPVSYYRRHGWDVSPGFSDLPLADFDRVVGEQCLFCHSRGTEFIGKRRLAEGASIEAIDCSRCHGDTRQHVSHPSRSNIINPSRLAERARDSICEQCHLEGVARVLNPGKGWQDFHAGEELEMTFSVYVDDQRQPTAKVVSQVEQLALSRCARESNGKLWCGTCHNPHGQIAGDRAGEVRVVCNTCHPTVSRAAHPDSKSDCVGCHMRRLSPRDVAHVASTDHRILARPAQAVGTVAAGSLRPWHDPPAELRQRNLGLADLEASRLPELHALGAVGGRLLEEMGSDQVQSDAAVLAALGDVALSEGRSEQSQLLFLKASELAPANGEYLLYRGIALKRKGDWAEAATALRKAISVDASLQQAYLELAALDSQLGKGTEAANVLKEYLKWNPQSVLIRSTLEAQMSPAAGSKK